MRLGIFGGSFDPVHFGHLRLAACCHDQGRLGRIWFVPAATPPHKQEKTSTPIDLRIEMLELALADVPYAEVCRLEMERGGISYTLDTLAEIRRRRPDDELFLLLGSDSLADLPTWHRPDEVCRLASPMVVFRAGWPEPDFSVLDDLLPRENGTAIRGMMVEMPPTAVTSTEIRRRVELGQNIDGMTPPEVVRFIEERGIYRGPMN